MTVLTTLRDTMYIVCYLQKNDFRVLVGEHLFEQAEAFAASNELVLTNLPYNIRCIRDDEKFNH